jgi:hypothetical protein
MLSDEGYSLLFVSFVVAVGLSCTATTPTPTATETLSDDQRALHVLVAFLESLHVGKYEEAARLSGGTYEAMIDHNPSIDPNDHVALLRNACTINGTECLEMKNAGLDRAISPTEFVFKVDFLNADGSLFVRGPCCGGSETDFPPESVFLYKVVKTSDGRFLVMDMPPYVP